LAGKGGEARLHNLYSIGVGGHINPVDAGDDILVRAMLREFNEELDYSGDFTWKVLGFSTDPEHRQVRARQALQCLIGEQPTAGIFERMEILDREGCGSEQLKWDGQDPS